MSDGLNQEPLLDMYIFETTQLIEQLEQIIINNEKSGCFKEDSINEVFRIMHTIKGSSAMMMFDDVTKLAHSMEDLFYFIRENKSDNVDCSKLSDIVLEGVDFIKNEVNKVIEKKKPDGNAYELVLNINNFLSKLKECNETQEEVYKQLPVNEFKAVIRFEEGSEMEDIRAFGVIQGLNDIAEDICHVPEELFENSDAVNIICKTGFEVSFKTNKNYEEIHKHLMQTPLMSTLELTQLNRNDEVNKSKEKDKFLVGERIEAISEKSNDCKDKKPCNQGMISVNVSKLDSLMDMVGELVISQSMVVQNPDLKGLNLDNFQKAARQLQKITSELQNIVMSIRMVPLAATFQKMNRVIRDMSKKLSKEIRLEILGEDTEVDKNIIEHISDPLMHLVRNSMDHGLESSEERIQKGKSKVGTITLEAKNEGGDAIIVVRDDGRGLDRDKILHRAIANGLIINLEGEISDREVYSCIFLPGFSTKDKVTEYSGRGVGMDVVIKNINDIGGSISVDSNPNIGTTITLKIPLTLAIMDGMIIKVGKSTYTIPIASIKESFRGNKEDVIIDPDGNEMIMLRGQCYPILRLHKMYKVKTNITNISDGIIVMVNNEDKNLCIFADELLGEQQVVIKALPEYIKNFNRVKGLSGCTLLGDGSISLILDIAGLINY